MSKTLRTISFLVLLVWLLFSFQTWPAANLVIMIAWLFALSAMIVGLVRGTSVVSREASLDLLLLALMSVILMRSLHLPGRIVPVVVMVLAGIALLWFDRDRLWLGGARAGPKALFYATIILVLAGTFFRIQHWPYSTAMLIGGLALAAAWFFSSMKDDRKEQ